MPIATELRAELARILKRHYGHVPDAIAAIRVATVEKIDAYVAGAEERLSACTCKPEPTFEIPERDDGKHAPRMFAVYAKAEADFAKMKREMV